MAAARELLERSRTEHAAGQAEEALALAKEALEKFRADGDQAGAAEALRPVVGGQIELLELAPDKAQLAVKEQAAKIKKSAPDGKLADALIHLAVAEVHLFKAESDKALKAASEAASALAKESEWKHESAALLMVVNAQLMRSNGPKAVAAANGALSAAQKAGEKAAEAAAWLSVATARHVSGGDDAREAAQRAVSLFRDVGDRSGEASAQVLSAQIDLVRGEVDAAASAAREALATARGLRNGTQTAAALEALVEAQIAADQKEQALTGAESALAAVERDAAGSASKGVAATMCAVVLAHTACRGIDSALALVKRYVVELRERGDRRGEVRLLHKLATMSPVPAEALNTAQAALALAQQIGDASQEEAIKSSMTDMYAARGKVEKAPNRKAAMKALGEMAKALESKDADRFEDAVKYLDSLYNALKQEDVETALSRVIAKDPAAYMAFLQDHGQMVADEKPTTVTSCTVKPVPHELMYFTFTSGGISYGPRYRVNNPAWKKFNDETRSISVIQLAESSDQWERELAYNPSMLDGCLQHMAATGY